MDNVVKFTRKTKHPNDVDRVDIHVCGVCGSEQFWLLAKSITDDVAVHGIACARCGNKVQGTWQPQP